MSSPRRNVVIWVVAAALLALAQWGTARYLATSEPLAALLAGDLAAVLTMAGLVAMRLVLYTMIPAWGAWVVMRLVLDRQPD